VVTPSGHPVVDKEPSGRSSPHSPLCKPCFVPTESCTNCRAYFPLMSTCRNPVTSVLIVTIAVIETSLATWSLRATTYGYASFACRPLEVTCP